MRWWSHAAIRFEIPNNTFANIKHESYADDEGDGEGEESAVMQLQGPYLYCCTVLHVFVVLYAFEPYNCSSLL